MNYYNEIKNKLIDNEMYSKVKDYSKERYKLNTYYEVGHILSKAGKKYGENIIDFDVEDGINLKDSIVKGFVTYEGCNSDSFTQEMIQSRADIFKATDTSFNEKEEVIVTGEKTLINFRMPIVGDIIGKSLKDIEWPCKILLVTCTEICLFP